MPRPPKVQDEILEFLHKRGNKGANRKEFNEKFGEQNYPYYLLLGLVKEHKVSKFSDRWYYGSPADWLTNIEPDAWIQLNTPSVKAIRKDTFSGYEQYIDKNLDILRQRAIEGLEDYFMYCRILSLPYPVFDGEMSQDERNQAVNSLVQLQRRFEEYFND